MIDLGRDPLPPWLRDTAALALLDMTEWFGDTSGGIRTYLLQKAQYVAAHPGWRHSLVVPGHTDAIADDGGTRTYRLRGPRIPGQAPYRLLLSARKLARIVAHERPSIIEVGSPFIAAWLARRIAHHARVPIVSYYHANVPRLVRSTLLQDGARRYLRTLHSSFALTIASSEYAMRELHDMGITAVVRVPLGVDTGLFHPQRRARTADTRARHGLPATRLAAFMGRFAAEKELFAVLDAWPQVERATGTQLVFIGAGPQGSALRAHRYGARVHFLPFQSDRTDVANLLAAVELYVAPGRIETFGLSSLEALASGTPLLAANAGGVAEQVRSSGAGRMFEAGNAESLAAEAIALLNGDLGEPGKRGREYAVANHGWDTVMHRLFDVYRDVIGAHAAR